MLERLHVRPELAAFAGAIRDRVARLALFENQHFSKTCSAERDALTGELVVISEFAAGTRLSDLLEASLDQSAVPGVDVALGYLLDALPALTALHEGAGFAHGLIDPGRTLITPEGRIVFTDSAYGAVVEHLGLSRRKLWSDFGVAAPVGSGPLTLDQAGDVSQVALCALMLVLGRALEVADYPDRIPTLLVEVIEVAQIRGSSGFAGGFQRVLQRCLPLPGRRPYATAEEAAADLRQLARREIGLDQCRKALADFVRQMTGDDMSAVLAPEAHEADEELSEETLQLLTELEAAESEQEHSQEETGDAFEFDLDLDAHVETGRSPAPEDEVYELSVADVAPELSPVAPDLPVIAPEPSVPDAPPEYLDPPVWAEESRVEAAPPEPDIALAALDEMPPTATAAPEPTLLEEAPWTADPVGPDPELSEAAVPPLETAVNTAPPAPEPAELLEASSAPADPVQDTRSSSRRKRNQHKSARARKDKLRSTAAPPATTAPPAAAAPPQPSPAAVPPAPAEPPAPAPSKSGWLVPPDKASKFEPPVPEPARAVPEAFPAPVQPIPVAPPFSQPAASAPPPAAPVFAPPPVAPSPYQPSAMAPPPQPVYPPQGGIPMPRYGSARVTQPGPIAPVSAAPAVTVDAGVAQLSTVKVKAEPPAGYVPTSKRRQSVVPNERVEPVLPLPQAYRGSLFEEPAPARNFPWKLAAAALVIVAAGVVAGRHYLPGRAAAEPPAAQAATTPVPEPVEPAAVVQPKGTGQIVLQTEPAGAKVLLDGKPVGETPVAINAVPAGRHVLTLTSSSGTVKRTVKVAAGKSVNLDVPIFSGWISVLAPFVVEVAEDGKSVGTTEQGKVMLAPGHHRLTFSNHDLGYATEQDLEVTAGDVHEVRLNPKGSVSFNAAPWAEVWMDGVKIGETPIANHPLPLGSREFVFRNPQYGDRKVTATVRADQPAALSVDFTK